MQFLNNTSVIQRQAHFRFGAEVPPRPVQPGRQPVRARPVDVRPEAHAEPAQHRPGGDAFAGFLLGKMYQAPKPRSRSPKRKFRANSFALYIRRHLEDRPEVDALVGLTVREHSAVGRPDRPPVLGLHPVLDTTPQWPTAAGTRCSSARATAPTRTPASNLRWPNIDVVAGRAAWAIAWCNRQQRLRAAHRPRLDARADKW